MVCMRHEVLMSHEEDYDRERRQIGESFSSITELPSLKAFIMGYHFECDEDEWDEYEDSINFFKGHNDNEYAEIEDFDGNIFVFEWTIFDEGLASAAEAVALQMLYHFENVIEDHGEFLDDESDSDWIVENINDMYDNVDTTCVDFRKEILVQLQKKLEL